MKILPVGAKVLMRTDRHRNRRTDVQTEAHYEVQVTFRNFPKAPKNAKIPLKMRSLVTLACTKCIHSVHSPPILRFYCPHTIELSGITRLLTSCSATGFFYLYLDPPLLELTYHLCLSL